jgi:hypothetical protein
MMIECSVCGMVEPLAEGTNISPGTILHYAGTETNEAYLILGRTETLYYGLSVYDRELRVGGGWSFYGSSLYHIALVKRLPLGKYRR